MFKCNFHQCHLYHLRFCGNDTYDFYNKNYRILLAIHFFQGWTLLIDKLSILECESISRVYFLNFHRAKSANIFKKHPAALSGGQTEALNVWLLMLCSWCCLCLLLTVFCIFSISGKPERGENKCTAHKHKRTSDTLTQICSQRSVVAYRLDKMLQLPQATASCVFYCVIWISLKVRAMQSFFPHSNLTRKEFKDTFGGKKYG